MQFLISRLLQVGIARTSEELRTEQEAGRSWQLPTVSQGMGHVSHVGAEVQGQRAEETSCRSCGSDATEEGACMNLGERVCLEEGRRWIPSVGRSMMVGNLNPKARLLH